MEDHTDPGAVLCRYLIMTERERWVSWEEVRRQVEQNDPNLCDLSVMYGEEHLQLHGLVGCIFLNTQQVGDFGEFGASIGQNTCLKDITFECKAEIMGGDFVDFLCDLRLNRSIEKRTFYGCDFDSKNMFDVLIPFFIGNQALESRHVHGDVCGLLASALGQFR